MLEMGFLEVETYVSRHQNTITQFIATRPIMELCLASERSLWSRLTKWWWDQYVLDVEVM